MPTNLTRSPQRAAPTYSLPVPDDEEEDQPVQEESGVATRVTQPAGAAVGTTGGLVPQGAGTWDRPDPGRLSDDPRVRQQQSLQRAQTDFEDKQREQNPFIFSNDVKQLSRVGGRRYEDRAIRAGENAYADQVAADRASARALRAAQKLDTDTYNSRAKAHFEGRGMQYYTDPLSKRLTPVVEEETGRTLYHESNWSPATHPKTGLAVMEKRDKYGQRQYKRPTLSDSADPEDEYLYADMGDGESTPYITKEQAAKSPDISLAKMGLAALKKQRAVRNAEAIQGMLAVDASIDQEVLGAQEQADAIQRQIDELGPKAMNTGDTEVNRAAYQSRIEQLNGELQKHVDALAPQGELKRRQRLSKKTIGLTRAQAALDAYATQKAEIETRLRAKGVAPEDYDKDPLYQQNALGMRAMEKAVAGGQSSLASEDALAGRQAPPLGSVVQPGQPPSDGAGQPADLEAGEPFALAQRGAKNIGGVKLDEFARRYGDGRNISPDSLLKLAARSKEIADTLANEGTRIDDKLRNSLTQEQQYADQLIKQRMARLPADQQARVQQVLDLKNEGAVKSSAKSGLRGALSEGVYSTIEGGARLLSRIPESANGILGLPKGAQKFYREYADATARVRQQIRDALPLDEQFSQSMTGQITQGLGQAAGTLPMAVLPGGIALPAITQIYDEGYQDAKASGATDEQANSAALKYIPAATLDYLSEKLIVGKIMKPLVGKMSVGRLLKDILVSAATEGGTEGAQQAYLNQIASKLEGYDPNRPFDQEVYDSMLVGAVTGGVATGVGQTATSLARGGSGPTEGGNAQTPAPTPPGAPVADVGVVDEFNAKLDQIPGGPKDATNMTPEEAEAELQQRLDASDLTPEERAEFERLRAEGEVVEAPTRDQRQADLEAAFGSVTPERVNPKSAEGSAEVFMEQAGTPSAVASMERDAERAQAERAAPADELAAVAETRDVVDAERAAAAQAGVSVEELRQARANQDAAGGARTDSEIPTSNERTNEPAATQPPEPTAEVPRGVAEETRPDVPAREEVAAGRPPVVEQSAEATAADRKKYDMLQKRMSTLLKKGGAAAVESDAYQSAWQQSEDIKNRHGGMPPGEVAAESQPKPEETQNALQERGSTRVFQREPEQAGEAGSERGRVEPSVQGEETPRAQAKENGGDESVQAPVAPTAELRKNNAGINLPPVSSLSASQKLAELKGGGITTYAGKPIDEANPAQLSNALGKFRRGELTAKGERPSSTQPLLTERAEAALKKLKIDTRDKAFSGETAIAASAWNTAIDLAILAARAGRPLEQAIRLAVARYRAMHKQATEEDVTKLTKAITDAHATPPEPKPTTTKPSKTPESLKEAGAPVTPIDYEVRRQEERKQEASDIIKRDGREKAERALSDKSIPGDTRVAIGGQLINDRMLELKDAKPEDISRITKDIQRITAKIQPELSTQAGQTIAMHAAIYKDVRTAAAMEYVREATKKRIEAMGGEEASAAAQDAADIFNKNLTPEERDKAIEKLKQRYTTKPVRRMLNEFKRMETAKKLNKLGVLTRDDMVEVAGNALGIPGISQKKLKHLSEIADRIENAKSPAERVKAELELADTLSIYKGINPLDLESSILTLNILSGPTTQLANLEGNALNAIAQIGTTALANPTKIGPLVKGLLDGISLGGTQARSILQTGRGTRDLQDKTSLAGSALQTVDYARDFPVVGEKTGNVLTARARAVEKIGRFMKAADAIFYYPAREAYARMVTTKLLEGNIKGAELDKAVRQHLHITPEAFKSAQDAARTEGYEGIDLARRTSDIIEQRRAETAVGAQAVKESERFAAEATYNQEPEGLAGVVYRNAAHLLDEFRVGSKKFNFQALKPWLMFLKVPANVFNATTNFTPLGALRAETGIAGAKKGEWRNFNKDERNRLYIQSVIGSVLMGGLIYRVLNKEDVDVTAGGPANPAQKKQLQQGGWLPYSIKIGGKYYSYKDSPLLVPLSIVGNVADSVKYQKSKDDLLLESKVVDAIGQAPQTIFQTSMLSGFADLMSSLSSKNGAQGVGRSLAGVPANLVIPYNRLLQQIDQIFDKKQYDTNAIQRTIPFARRAGPVKTDVQGRPETYDPFNRFGSPESKDPLDVLIREKQVFVPDVSSAQKIGDRAMTDDERDRFRQFSGQRIRARLMGMVPTLRGLDKEGAQDAIDRVAREERARAKAMLSRMPAPVKY